MVRDAQLSRSAYFVVAMSILREHGFESVTIQSMCDRLGATKGSFYHHFDGMADFIDGLMDHWESRETAGPFDEAEATGSSIDRSRSILESALGLDHAAERAIRVWSTTNERVAAAQRRVDEARQNRVQRVWEDDGLDARTATTAARMGLAIVIGFQNCSTGLDLPDLESALTEMTEHFRQRIRTARR